jgi:hypothetical protein
VERTPACFRRTGEAKEVDMDREHRGIPGWAGSYGALLTVLFAGACAGGPEGVTSEGATLAFTDARVWDGTGRPPIEDGVVLVRDGKISAVGSASQVSVPAGAEVVTLDGRWVVPGLVNAHGHVGPDGERTSVAEELEIYAHYGITTVLSLGDEAEHMREERWSPTLRRARLFVAGPRVGA